MRNNKKYLHVNSIDKFQDNINGRTRVTIEWVIDFSKLPYMNHLLNFLEDVMIKESIWNAIDPTFDYEWNTDNKSFKFTTTAWVKVREGDRFNDVIGYDLAYIKNEKKALETYNKFIEFIYGKVSEYFVFPLDRINCNNNRTIDNLSCRFYRKVKYFN